jgi:hypothetical protein
VETSTSATIIPSVLKLSYTERMHQSMFPPFGCSI